MCKKYITLRSHSAEYIRKSPMLFEPKHNETKQVITTYPTRILNDVLSRIKVEVPKLGLETKFWNKVRLDVDQSNQIFEN